MVVVWALGELNVSASPVVSGLDMGNIGLSSKKREVGEGMNNFGMGSRSGKT
jgi:hypothetical protein